MTQDTFSVLDLDLPQTWSTQEFLFELCSTGGISAGSLQIPILNYAEKLKGLNDGSSVTSPYSQQHHI